MLQTIGSVGAFICYCVICFGYIRDGLPWSALLFFLYALSMPVIWMTARA